MEITNLVVMERGEVAVEQVLLAAMVLHPELAGWAELEQHRQLAVRL
jgi:glutamine amidotransferase PdxT